MKKILEEMKKHDVMMKSLIKIAQDKKTILERDYGKEGRLYQEALNEIQKDFDNGVLEAKKETIAAIEKGFESNIEKVKEAVIAPVPDELLNILQAVKASGGTLSKAESEVIAEKFAGCYLARKAFHSITDNAQAVFTSYEDMIERIEDTRKAAMNWVEHYDNTTYSHEMMISDTSILLVLDDEIKEFIA